MGRGFVQTAGLRILFHPQTTLSWIVEHTLDVKTCQSNTALM